MQENSDVGIGSEMENSKPIDAQLFTQAQVNAIITERLSRAKASFIKDVEQQFGGTVAETQEKLARLATFSDYEDIKRELNDLRAANDKAQYQEAVRTALLAYNEEGRKFIVEATDIIVGKLREENVGISAIAQALPDIAKRYQFLLTTGEPTPASVGQMFIGTPKRPSGTQQTASSAVIADVGRRVISGL